MQTVAAPLEGLTSLVSWGIQPNNLGATIRQHTLRAKALKNIELVNKNCLLTNNLEDAQDQMATMILQKQLLQEQLCTAPKAPSLNFHRQVQKTWLWRKKTHPC